MHSDKLTLIFCFSFCFNMIKCIDCVTYVSAIGFLQGVLIKWMHINFRSFIMVYCECNMEKLTDRK